MKRVVVALTMVALITVMLVAGIGMPASAQTINLSPGINVNGNASGDNVAVQCIANPLLGSTTPSLLGGGGQCANGGGNNSSGLL
jgi:hypothetical protein